MSQPIQNSNLSGAPVTTTRSTYASILADRTTAPTNTMIFTPTPTATPSRFAGFARNIDIFPAAFGKKKSSEPFPEAFSKKKTIAPSMSMSSPYVSPTLNDTEHTFSRDIIQSDYDRRVFLFKGNHSCEITATGIIYYKVVDNKIQLLISHVVNRDTETLEDLGGKTDICDVSPLASASREVEEETNSVINRELSLRLIKSVEPIYISNGKYLLFLVEAPEEISSLEKETFGSFEKCHNKKKTWILNRTIDWIPLEDFIKSSKIHIRLREALKDIQKIKS